MRGALAVECPECSAAPGYSCQSPSGYARSEPHRARLRVVPRTTTLYEALRENPELGELRDEMNRAALAVPYDRDAHDLSKRAFFARCSEVGVEFHKRPLGWGHEIEPTPAEDDLGRGMTVRAYEVVRDQEGRI